MSVNQRRKHIAILRSTTDWHWILSLATPTADGYSYGPALYGMKFRTRQAAQDNKTRIRHLRYEKGVA